MSKGNRYGKYRVGSATLLTFIQIKPGNEKTMVSKLYKGFPGATVCKVFGDCDVCMIQRFEGWPEQPLFTEEYQNLGMSNIRNVKAFGWAGLDGLDAAELQQYPALGICFLKANRQFLSKQGVKGEHQILEAINHVTKISKHNIKVRVFGTLGWYEIILMINGKRVYDVLEHANMIRRALIRVSESTLPCFETTVTIPAIICEADGTPKYADIGPKTNLEVRVSCHSWADSKIKSLLKKYLGPPSYVAGTDDFIVKKSPKKTLSGYTEQLWKFRKASSGMVYRTRTAFLVQQLDMSDSDLQVSVVGGERINFQADHPRLRLLKQSSLTVYQLFLETYSRLNDILADPRKSSAFKDLRAFANKLQSDLLKPKPDEAVDYIDYLVTLGQQLELLLFGMRQRCVGMEISESDWTGEPCYIGNSVGIQRILTALTSLPMCILKKLGASWSGFIITGFTETYHRYFGGPINMPVEAVYDPKMWFGIIHEIGHEYSTTQKDIMNNAALRMALVESASEFKGNLILASEIYSEIFSCLLGFNGNFDNYLRFTCEYLGKLPSTAKEMESLLLRLLMTYIFIWERGGDKYTSNKDDCIKLAKMLEAKLKKYIAEIDIEDGLLQRICDRVLELRIALDILRDLIPTISHAKVKKETYISTVRNGKILLNVTDPVYFIQQVVHTSPLSFQGATALILSLWNSEIRKST
jgi:hypothetical protein